MQGFQAIGKVCWNIRIRCSGNRWCESIVLAGYSPWTDWTSNFGH